MPQPASKPRDGAGGHHGCAHDQRMGIIAGAAERKSPDQSMAEA